jgi:hypothetical protein
VWVLRSNTKLICVYYCILFGFANIFQSFALEGFIKFAVTTNQEILEDKQWGLAKFIMQDMSEMIANLVAIVSIWKIMKEERREL